MCVERQIAVQLFVAAVSSAVGKEGGSNGSGSQLKEVAGKGGLWELEGNEEAMECRLNSPDGEEEREDISSLSTCYNAADGGFVKEQMQMLQLSKLTQAHCRRMVVVF